MTKVVEVTQMWLILCFPVHESVVMSTSLIQRLQVQQNQSVISVDTWQHFLTVRLDVGLPDFSSTGPPPPPLFRSTLHFHNPVYVSHEFTTCTVTQTKRRTHMRHIDAHIICLLLLSLLYSDAVTQQATTPSLARTYVHIHTHTHTHTNVILTRTLVYC